MNDRDYIWHSMNQLDMNIGSRCRQDEIISDIGTGQSFPPARASDDAILTIPMARSMRCSFQILGKCTAWDIIDMSCMAPHRK